MNDRERLKNARNLLLKLHKAMLDLEREMYEGVHRPVNAAEFLNLLLENDDFSWLRRFSMLIVEIDEMFDLRDGAPGEMVETNLQKVSDLVDMKDADDYFRAKYQFAIQRNADAAGLHSELRKLLADAER